MEGISGDLISIMKYLLPGFLTAWIFYCFTAYPKPSQFERIIQALIFTLIIQPVNYSIKSLMLWLGNFFVVAKWTEQSEITLSILCAVSMGFIFSYFANTDKFHAAIRKLGISKETSYPSEWFGVFSKNVTYVVLHLKDERRIYGWPMEWPPEQGSGHFSLTQASWLTDNEEIALANVDAILIPASEVQFVEFMSKTWEKENG